MLKYRYLIDFDTNNMEKEFFDVLIIGSGIAGVYTSLELDQKYKIGILTKEEMDISNSVLAQGGIAVSLDKNDSPDAHLKDTLYAGAGLCDENSVRVLVDEAAMNITKICDFGVEFDKKEKDGSELALSREAAHSTNRIIHAGDSTGKEVCDKLINSASLRSNISFVERTWVVDLLVSDDTCYGVLALDEKTGKIKAYYAGIVVCASGGFGQLYHHTTNPEVSTGDGAAFSYRAGGELMDIEFVQFHPTVLYHKDNHSFLISEAVRGEGGILRNHKGERFMPKYHELAELAPRDVVSRCIFKEMQINGDDFEYVDTTHMGKEYLENRFPMIYSTLLEYGIDMSKDLIPIAPAEHYCMGGIKTDIFGETKIKRFFACGESACTGIHGANRLASNSLLEGLVFGRRIGLKAKQILDGYKAEPVHFTYKSNRTAEVKADITNAAIEKLRNLMTLKVGIVRNGDDLKAALKEVRELKEKIIDKKNVSGDDFTLQNDTMLAEMIIESAIEREESRGAHYRSDFPETDDINWKKNIIKKL